MLPFATVDDLQTFLGDGGLDGARAALILESVSGEIRNQVGWSVTEETGVEVVLDGSGIDELLLPTLHLTAVTSVTENGATLGTADFLVYGRGSLRRVVGGCAVAWTSRPKAVAVVFDHGYPVGSVPAVFKSVTLEAAGRMTDNPGAALKSKTVGRVAITYADVKTAVSAAADGRLDFYRLPEGF